MKKIGIIMRDFILDDFHFLGTKLDLFHAFKEFDVATIGIPITNDFEKIKEAINLCDGIVLSGGCYNSENDYQIIKYCYDSNIPTLGICLGMQGMAMTYNNKEETEITNHNSTEEYVHYVNINKNTLLYKIIGEERIKVNSRHNYAIPKTEFTINAVSDDNIIEGIEDENKKFFLGLQWHPESINDNYSYQIFKYFINSL